MGLDPGYLRLFQPGTADEVSVPPPLLSVTMKGVRLKTPSNSGREHWSVIARRTKQHRRLAAAECMLQLGSTRAALLQFHRLRVRFVRIGGRKMDTTNIVAACKGLQDGLCDWLGVDDGSDWYEWQWPTQEPGKVYSVRIELQPLIKVGDAAKIT